jgi:hypothetical protein
MPARASGKALALALTPHATTTFFGYIKKSARCLIDGKKRSRWSLYKEPRLFKPLQSSKSLFKPL